MYRAGAAPFATHAAMQAGHMAEKLPGPSPPAPGSVWRHTSPSRHGRPQTQKRQSWRASTRRRTSGAGSGMVAILLRRVQAGHASLGEPDVIPAQAEPAGWIPARVELPPPPPPAPAPKQAPPAAQPQARPAPKLPTRIAWDARPSGEPDLAWFHDGRRP